MDDVDRISRLGAVLTTPNGFLPTPDSSFYHIHKSGWTVKDLRRKGYSVHGFGARLGNKLLPSFPKLAMSLHYALTPLSYLFPRFAGFLVATKNGESVRPEE